jgi:glucose/arabinose dehydrogenase
MPRFLLLPLYLLLLIPAIAQFNIGTGTVDELYQTHCATCHGAKLEGGQGSSLIDDEWKYGGTDADLTRIITQGLPDEGMVPWQETLSAEQIRALVIYIREQGRLARSAEPAPRPLAHADTFPTRHHRFTLERVTEIEDVLWSMAFLPDGSILLAQRDGFLWRYADGANHFIENIPEVWQHGQGGLLEVALHPDYATNGWIYLGYSENTGARENGKTAGKAAIVRGRIRDDQWVDQEDIFRVPGKFHTSSAVHFGTRFVFQDGYLFFSIGDRGRMHMAQDVTKPNGKIHRIHDDGRIPPDNPFVDQTDAYPSLWSLGNRNPQGLALHPVTGELWETEHGPRGGDEVNLIRRGLNYGWPEITYGMNYNGTPITAETAREGLEQPALHWTPSIAVCGIDFYTGDQFPSWQNHLLVGGLASQELHRLVLDGDRVIEDEVILSDMGRVRDVATGPDGSIYVAINSNSSETSILYRLVPAEE